MRMLRVYSLDDLKSFPVTRTKTLVIPEPPETYQGNPREEGNKRFRTLLT